EERPRDPAGLERGEDRVGEVEAGGRRSDRTRNARVDRLIAGTILRCSGSAPVAPDVRRQRDLAVALEERLQARGILPEFGLPRLSVALARRGHEAAWEAERRARGHAAGSAQERAPELRAHRLDEKHLDLSATRPRTVQARRDHLRVVEDEEIA